MKAGPKANLFGKFLMTTFRDAGIESIDRLLAGESRAPGDRAVQKSLKGLDAETRDLVRQCVIQVLDGATSSFLFQLHEVSEEPEAGAPVVTVDGVNVATQSDGLHGELWTEEGWLERYSKYGESGTPRARRAGG